MEEIFYMLVAFAEIHNKGLCVATSCDMAGRFEKKENQVYFPPVMTRDNKYFAVCRPGSSMLKWEIQQLASTE